MKQSVPKATVAGGRHAWSRTLTAEGFESWTDQYLLPFRNSNKFIRI